MPPSRTLDPADESFDFGNDDSLLDADDASIDQGARELMIDDTEILRLLPVPVDIDALPRNAPTEVLFQALRQCQSGYMQLSHKTRELCLENMALEEQLKKKRKGAGGRVPAQLVPYTDPIIKAAKRYALTCNLWVNAAAFKAVERPNVDVLSMTRYRNKPAELLACAAEVFDCIGDMTKGPAKGLNEYMGKVSWIGKRWSGVTSQQKSYFIANIKAAISLCLPEPYRQLPFDNAAALRVHPDAIYLRGDKKTPFSPLIFPDGAHEDMQRLFDSRSIIEGIRAMVGGGRACLQGQRGKLPSGCFAEVIQVEDVVTPAMIAAAYVILRHLLSGEEQFKPSTSSHKHQDDYELVKRTATEHWNSARMMRLVTHYRECIYHGRNPDLHPAAPTMDPVSAAEERTRNLLAQARQAMNAPIDDTTDPSLHSNFDDMYASAAPRLTQASGAGSGRTVSNRAQASARSTSIPPVPRPTPAFSASRSTSAATATRSGGPAPRAVSGTTSSTSRRVPTAVPASTTSTSSSPSHHVPAPIPASGQAQESALNHDLDTSFAELNIATEPIEPPARVGRRAKKTVAPADATQFSWYNEILPSRVPHDDLLPHKVIVR
ncbi:hypothetical protein PHLGIDRAFT_17040 [Phlebiopsis gigantea 11061_1 CR5-6]|uniref:Uncharacterized protein n=1 Tax=Phlebiopsis gigantea (strain 11061_1 CR5-6) TaxID=745531 RepID=A0A0C3RPY7_PHLG1|nr:hypothetical protein PHLGIDRAFT_17040 [Phlebiopsis gigantea 11061_1 CR5-6]